jgi:pantothenate kinase
MIGPVNQKINESGVIDKSMKPKKHYFSLGESLYPYLLVNLRSGATFTIVESANSCRRVCGTTIGVSFAIGVLRYLDMFKDPTDMCEAARHGDSSKIDMSVGDIYGD